MKIIHTAHSCWQAARIAIQKLVLANEKGVFASTLEEPPMQWIAIDVSGDVIVGYGEPSAAWAVIVRGEELDRVLAAVVTLLSPSEETGILLGSGSAEEIAMVALLVEQFENVLVGIGPDPELWEPTVSFSMMYGSVDPCTVRVHYAAPSPRDRVEGHIARGCAHCGRPRFAFPEQPGRWSSVDAWRNRWEATGLSASEAALWTDMVGCRPEVAMELRASGLTPARFQRCVAQWMGDSMLETELLADDLLSWTRSGFSWPEIDQRKGWLDGSKDLEMERELRSRGIDFESSEQEIEVDGLRMPLCDYLILGSTRDGREMTISEKMTLLEKTGQITPRWAGLS